MTVHIYVILVLKIAMAYTLEKENISMKKIAKAFKKYVPHFILASAVLVVFAAVVLQSAAPVSAQAAAPAKDPNSDPTTYCAAGTYGTVDKPCVTRREVDLSGKDPSTLSCSGNDCGGIVGNIVQPAIDLMTAIVGIIIAASIVVGGITYSSAGGDPSKVAAAKKRITNSVIALIAYLFTAGLLQWLVPGGFL